MANVDSPNGLKPVSHLDGSPYNGLANRYYVPDTDGTAIFVGDMVTSAGSADANGVPSVTQASAGGFVLGVVVGIEPRTDEDINFRAASTERYLFVSDSPDVVYEIQEDSVGGALAAANVGNNADLIVGAGNTDVGRSGMELDSNTAGTGSAQLRILRLVPREDNEIGNFAKWLVMINEHEWKQTSGT